MPQPQLSVRSARARTLAHRLAKKERRSVSQVVERALELYAKESPKKETETPIAFWSRVVQENHIEGDADIDLFEIIKADLRRPPRDIDL